MWSTTLANFKENLNKIAQDVHDDDDEEEEPSSSIYHNNNYSPDRDDDSPPISNRRHSNRSGSFSNSPLSNGIDSAPNSQVCTNKFHLFLYIIVVDSGCAEILMQIVL